MKTPNDINGIRTEAIMKRIANTDMPVSDYNEMYTAIYDTLKKISIENLHRCLKEDIKFFDHKQPNANDQFDQRTKT